MSRRHVYEELYPSLVGYWQYSVRCTVYNVLCTVVYGVQCVLEG